MQHREKIHLIAMGGSVMHQLAIALKKKGYAISGSDDEIYEPARSNLEKAGILPDQPGWHPERITPDTDAVILGMHARADNPEIQQARALNVPVFSFPEYIYQESREKIRVVIGGSHGKTTITSMILHVLSRSGKDFDYLVGAKIPGFDYSVKLSQAPLIICEGDEYPASAVVKKPKFLFYHPDIAVISGIAWDHVNVFPTFESYLQQFALFLAGMHEQAVLIYNQQDDRLRTLVETHGQHLRLMPYRTPPYRIEDARTIVSLGEKEVPLQVFGTHNLQNIAAAHLVCVQLGIADEAFSSAIATFSGASRRLEKVFEKPGAALFRDFAHAPSKVKASIDAVREQFADRRLAAVLELHTFSSLNVDFLPQYRGAMDQADVACVFYSQHALQVKRLPALSAGKIKAAFGRPDMMVLQQAEELRHFLRDLDPDNTNLLMMSSGSFEGMDTAELTALWQKKAPH